MVNGFVSWKRRYTNEQSRDAEPYWYDAGYYWHGCVYCSYSNPGCDTMTRLYTNKLLDMLDEGVIDPKQIAADLLLWMSEDDVKEFYFAREYDEFYPEDEDNG